MSVERVESGNEVDPMLPDDANATQPNTTDPHSSLPPTRRTAAHSGGWGVSATQPTTVTPDSAIAPARVVTLPLVGTDSAHDDAIAVEAPLEVRLGGKPLTVLMRTPGHDEELVAGFLFGEGVIADADELLSIERPADLSAVERGNVVNVSLLTARRTPAGDRLFFSNSSCGICGKQSLASVEVRGEPVRSELKVSPHVLAALPERLRAAQPVFA